MWLVVGLGNPGPAYEQNRHNVGFMVIDELRRRSGAGSSRLKFGGEVVEGTMAGTKALFLKPMEFMNVSGEATVKAAQFYKIAPDSCVVVHDELDLPFARMKLGAGGGPGGHNGLKSLISHLGPDFRRVRVGIGRPPAGRDAAAYVLSDFSRAERKELPFLIGDAADAVEAIVRDGLPAAMNKFNTQKSPQTKG